MHSATSMLIKRLHEFFHAVTPLDLKQTVQVDKDLEIRAYYAGHVICSLALHSSYNVFHITDGSH